MRLPKLHTSHLRETVDNTGSTMFRGFEEALPRHLLCKGAGVWGLRLRD